MPINLSETDLPPFLALDPEVEHVFLLAHQDDEFGVFPLIEFLVRRGSKIMCMFLTASADAVIARKRDAESIKVLAGFGLPVDNLNFLGNSLGVHDGELHLHAARVAREVERILINRLPVRLYVPAYEGGHHDHDSTCAIGAWLGGRIEARSVMQFPLYHGKGLPGPWFKVASPISENGEGIHIRYSLRDALRYSLFCLQYHSQWRTWLGLFPFLLFVSMMRRAQVLQPLSRRIFSTRPHSGDLFYERRFGVKYQTVAKAIKALSKI